MTLSPSLAYALFALLAVVAGLLAALIWLVLGDRRARTGLDDEFCDAVMEGIAETRRTLAAEIARTDAKLSSGLSSLITYSTAEQKRSSDAVERFAAEARGDLARMNDRLARTSLELQGTVDRRFANVLERNAAAQEATNAKLQEAFAQVRGALDASLEKVRAENARKLEEMRATVGEKLESTLSERLSASFRMVDDKLGLVQSGLGEMREMARGVTRLQNILANVKTRGTFGEVQLGAILSEILTPAQYAAQVQVDPLSRERVDFAVRLPGRGEGDVCWLPIDSKFPLEDWERLEAAAREGDAEGTEAARAALERAILLQAKSIRAKYVRPPRTTEFAVMFLHSEGLYAEVLRTPGLFERLQREHRVTPAGPSVVSALLNSLLMGFMTLAMERRSAEVWKLLAEVRRDFEGFTEQFAKVERKFEETRKSLEGMSARSRRMSSSMRSIAAIADGATREAAEESREAPQAAPEAAPEALAVTAGPEAEPTAQTGRA